MIELGRSWGTVVLFNLGLTGVYADAQNFVVVLSLVGSAWLCRRKGSDGLGEVDGGLGDWLGYGGMMVLCSGGT